MKKLYANSKNKTRSWLWLRPWILFFFLMYLFNWSLVTLQYCSGFCQTSTWISHRCTCVPQPEPPSHLLPHPIPEGHPSAPALSTLSHALKLDQQSASHMIIYTFQCYPLKLSHPRLLLQSPKDCSIHLCLFCFLSCGIYGYHFSKFHICVLVYCIGVFLSGLLHSV